MPQPRWIKYGSRVLLSIIEESDADRTAISTGSSAIARIWSGKLREAHDPGRRALAEKVLRAHDFVYDSYDDPADRALHD